MRINAHYHFNLVLKLGLGLWLVLGLGMYHITNDITGHMAGSGARRYLRGAAVDARGDRGG